MKIRSVGAQDILAALHVYAGIINNSTMYQVCQAVEVEAYSSTSAWRHQTFTAVLLLGKACSNQA